MDFWVSILLGNLTSEPQKYRGYGVEDINSSFIQGEVTTGSRDAFREPGIWCALLPHPATRLEVYHCRAAMPRPFSCCVEGPTTNGYL